jgi:RHH-type transcriptional regulator, rel operon repressor / antitoxin RelB
MKRETITLRMDQNKRAALDALASVLDRDRSYCINEAVEAYLEVHRWQIEQIKMAIAEADAGDFATDAEVDALNNKYKRMSKRKR